jgi:hypothetical protein
MAPTLLTIPYQALEVSNIHLTPFQIDKYGKWMAQLIYKDSSIDFHDVSVMMPPLRVVDYQPETSCLRLDLSPYPTLQVKLNLFYEYLMSTFYLHQQGFFHTEHLSMEDIQRMFYSLLHGNLLSLYIYPTTLMKYADGSMKPMLHIKSGDLLRCVIRFQGVSQLNYRDSIKLRLHHSVPSLWKLDK